MLRDWMSDWLNWMPGLSWKKTPSASSAESAGWDPAGGGANSPESGPLPHSGPLWNWSVSPTGGVVLEAEEVALVSAADVDGADLNAFQANPIATSEITAATTIVDHR